jgi:pimeloyl-ACP methyl ester carboxylesterase
MQPPRANESGFVLSADGVRIAFSSRGSGAPAVVFIHGGLANRSFWRDQVEPLSARYRVVTLDLAGHGDSGRNRAAWSLAAFGRDVQAVVHTLDLPKVVLVGNSLGGVVALEAAALMPGRAVGVIGVDTLQDGTERDDPAAVRARAQAFARDPQGACRAMIDMLFHPGAYPELRAWAEREMCATPSSVVVPMLESFEGYDMAGAFRRAGVPIRAINGDLFPTAIERNRTLEPTFDAVIMARSGHYPMLEQPEAFNRILTGLIDRLAPPPPPRRRR